MGWVESDLANREQKEREWLDSCPICGVCGEPIQDEEAYYIDGWICEECIESFKKAIIR